MTNEPPNLTLQQIVDGGFLHAGKWDINFKDILVLTGDAPKQPGVYIFVQAGIAHYVGVASKNLAQRLYFYGRPGISQRTNIRLNGLLRTEIANSKTVDVYVAMPPDLEWNGWKVSGPEGLEAAIIRNFLLPWNRRGTVPQLSQSKSNRLQRPKQLEDMAPNEAKSSGANTSTADRIRQYAEIHHFGPARIMGKTIIEISARDVHDGIGLRNAFPSVCQALSGRKIADTSRVSLTRRIGPSNSSTTVYVYELL